MTRIMVRMLLLAALSRSLSGDGWAAPVEVDVVGVDNSAGGPELTGLKTTDIVLNIPGFHTGAQLLIELDQGSVFQHTLGGILAPSSQLAASFPAVAFDTYVAYGDPQDARSFTLYGAAVNLEDVPQPGLGQQSLKFSDTSISIAWGPTDGLALPEGIHGFHSARVTLTDDAAGRWLYLASSGEEFTVVAPALHRLVNSPETTFAGVGVIRAGELVLISQIPEPATVWLLLLGAIGLAAGRRCRSGRLKARIRRAVNGRSSPATFAPCLGHHTDLSRYARASGPPHTWSLPDFGCLLQALVRRLKTDSGPLIP